MPFGQSQFRDPILRRPVPDATPATGRILDLQKAIQRQRRAAAEDNSIVRARADAIEAGDTRSYSLDARHEKGIEAFRFPPEMLPDAQIDRERIQQYVGEPVFGELAIDEDWKLSSVPDTMDIQGAQYQIVKDDTFVQGAQGAVFLAKPIGEASIVEMPLPLDEESHTLPDRVVKFIPVERAGHQKADYMGAQVENEVASWQQAGMLVDAKKIVSEKKMDIKTGEMQPSDEAAMLVLEQASGVDFSEFQKEKIEKPLAERFSPEEMLKMMGVFRTFLEQLEAARKKGLLHKDIKPDNVKIDLNNPLSSKILDWGLAYHTDGKGASSDASSLHGTLQYMHVHFLEPEHENDPGRDLYALSLVFGETIGVVTTKKAADSKETIENMVRGEHLETFPSATDTHKSEKEQIHDTYAGTLGDGGEYFAVWLKHILLPKDPSTHPEEYITEHDIAQEGYQPYIDELNQMIRRQNLPIHAKKIVGQIENYVSDKFQLHDLNKIPLWQKKRALETALEAGDTRVMVELLEEIDTEFTPESLAQFDRKVDLHKQTEEAYTSYYANVQNQLLFLFDQGALTEMQLESMNAFMDKANQYAKATDLVAGFAILERVQKRIRLIEAQVAHTGAVDLHPLKDEISLVVQRARTEHFSPFESKHYKPDTPQEAGRERKVFLKRFQARQRQTFLQEQYAAYATQRHLIESELQRYTPKGIIGKWFNGSKQKELQAQLTAIDERLQYYKKNIVVDQQKPEVNNTLLEGKYTELVRLRAQYMREKDVAVAKIDEINGLNRVKRYFYRDVLKTATEDAQKAAHKIEVLHTKIVQMESEHTGLQSVERL